MQINGIELIPPPWQKLDDLDQAPRKFGTGDHFGGFDQHFNNLLLERLDRYADQHGFVYEIHVDEFLNENIKSKYQNVDLIYSFEMFNHCRRWNQLEQYRIHPQHNYKNFLCSFNGTAHVSRKLLISILKKLDWYDTGYVSKNMSFGVSELQGHVQDLAENDSRFYMKFFVDEDSETFFRSINSFGDYLRCDHVTNVRQLEHRLTQSFLHVVSETMSTSYQPFVTEKFLYSVVTRGLFLAYAPVNWHQHLEHYYGFRPYDKIFDYEFDHIGNPVKRLVALMCMISKFAKLSVNDWTDLYLMELDTIEYNYDWYHSKQYLKHMQQFSF